MLRSHDIEQLAECRDRRSSVWTGDATDCRAAARRARSRIDAGTIPHFDRFDRQTKRLTEHNGNRRSSAGADVLRAAQRFYAAVRVDADGACRGVSFATPRVDRHAEAAFDSSVTTFAMRVPLLRPADQLSRSFDLRDVGRLQLFWRLVDVCEEHIDGAFAELACDVVQRGIGQRTELRMRRSTPRSVGTGVCHKSRGFAIAVLKIKDIWKLREIDRASLHASV